MKKFAVAAAAVLLAPVVARAADPGVPSGFYFGGHAGYTFGNAIATLTDLVGSPTSTGFTSGYGMLFGGAQVGYQQTLPSRWMWGAEFDLSFADFADNNQVLSYRATGAASADEQLEYLGTLRGRLGYAMGRWTPFVTGGLAFASTRYSLTDLTTGTFDTKPGQWRFGYSVGGGIDYALGGAWSGRFEYLYTALPLVGFGFGFAQPAAYYSQYDNNRFRVALNYHFNEAKRADKDAPEVPDRGPGSWEIHGQTTFIFQGYPPFNAPYSGANSLPPEGQSRETWTTSAFLGARLWQGGELYFNPELLQGFGVADTTGAAGYPNGEAQKSNFPYPRFSVSRLFLRQEFGLGGAREKVESDYGQLSGEKDISRLTFQIGRYSVHDLFDTNDYAQDARIDFLNWSIWAAGAFDYAADRIGLTYGATAEWNEANWAARVGYFLVGNQPNSNVYDMNLFTTGQYVAELELRYKVADRPGVAKFGGWVHNSFAGNYYQALNLVAATGLDAPTAITQVSRVQSMWGYYINLQQEITDDLGAFARWSWNDGQSQYSAFTDISASVSGGVSIKGKRWNRPDDVVGIAGAINFASPALSSFLANGGLGILVGDGALSYAPEKVVETYYAFQMTKGLVMTFDYQFMSAPAYNLARGPAHFFAGRVRASF
jgi:high affinity Mn2+ porin